MAQGRTESKERDAGRAARRLTVQTRDGSAQRQYDRHDYLEALREAWALAREGAEALSEQRYGQLVASGEVDGPSAVRVIQVFKTWSAALAAAGVPALRPTRTYQSHWTDAEILAAVGEYLCDRDTSGSYAGWDPWRRELRPTAPSAQTLRNRFGSWSQIKEQALRLVTRKASDAEKPAMPGSRPTKATTKDG